MFLIVYSCLEVSKYIILKYTFTPYGRENLTDMNYYTIYFINQTLRFDRLYLLKALSMVPLFMIVFFFSVDMAHLIPVLDAWDKQAMIALNFAGSEPTRPY